LTVLREEGDYMNTMALRLSLITFAALALVPERQAAQVQAPQVIEILADHDSRYKIAGQKDPVVTVHAGEQVTLRITAVKAKNHNRDGSIHGFSLLRAKDRSRVPGWDFLLKPGTQEFMLNAPAEAGEYVVVCTVICGEDHEGMHMRFVVVP
jgi:heme/copper-type cytochrome/quinol oxidase subunit 2